MNDEDTVVNESEIKTDSNELSKTIEKASVSLQKMFRAVPQVKKGATTTKKRGAGYTKPLPSKRKEKRMAKKKMRKRRN